jgi:transcription factor SPT20
MSRFTTSLMDSYLQLLRRPLDMAVGLLPGRRTGPQAAARLTVDRVDAGVRMAIGAAIGDQDLAEQGRRRQEATGERERAMRLRQEAQEAEEASEARLKTRHEEADRRREQARARAASRRRQADAAEQEGKRSARQTETRRRTANRRQAQATEEQIKSRSDRERLPALQEQAAAVREREAALQEAAEAERIGEAAARVKAKRKSA